MYLTYVVLSLLMILLSRKMYTKWINPLGLFFYVWNFCIGLYEIKLIDFYDMNIKTWFVIIGLSSIYSVGIIGAYLFVDVKKAQTEDNDIYDSKIQNRLTIGIVGCLLIAAVSIVPKLIEVVHTYGFNLIMQSNQIYEDSIRQVDVNTSVGLENFVFLAIALSGIYLYYFGNSKTVIVCLVVAILDQLTSGSRGALFVEIALLMAPSLLLKRRMSTHKKVRNNYLLLILAGLFLVVITILRKSTLVNLPYASNILYKLGGMSQTVYNIIFYFTSPIATLNVYLQHPFHSVFGAATFRPIYLVLNSLGVTEYNVDFIKEYLEYSPLPANVMSFMGELIYDFNYAGACVGVFILSVIFSVAYNKSLNNKYTAWTIVLSVSFTLVILSFFAWFLRPAYLWFTLILGILVMAMIKLTVGKNKNE